jgi:iron(III) transport system substrate-binding protein
MKDWTARIIVLALLVVVVGIPFLLRPAVARREGEHATDPNARLVILTPHNEQIRYEIARAFNDWRKKQGKAAIEFDWRTGGTRDLRKQIETEFIAKINAGQADKGIEKDLLFGGGDRDHDGLADGIAPTGQKDKVSLAAPVDFPAGMLEAVYPSDLIGNVRLYHKDRLWVGVALSSFGIVYNRDQLAKLGLPEPKTWSDLRDGGYRNWVALSDPAHSSSVAVTYNTIIARQGWTEGWATLRRAFANARYFTASSSKVPVDVSAGEAAAGMCIDFYGRVQAGAVNRSGSAGAGRVGYVDPASMTAITPDPIMILRGAPHRELANEFVLWLLSPEAQGLWPRKKGTPGGPHEFDLRRMPVRRDLYNPTEMANWADQIRPFEIAKPLPEPLPLAEPTEKDKEFSPSKAYYPMVAPIAHAIAIDIHDELKDAWDAIIEHPDHPKRREMLELFDAMPPELTLVWPDAEVAANWDKIIEDRNHPRYKDVAKTLEDFTKKLKRDDQQMLRDRMKWTEFFRKNYERIVEELE